MVDERRRDGAPRASGKPIHGASEQVAVQIQHHIQREGLGPDDFLGREEDLAAGFGVSRPTLREALKLLTSGNLIRANKGPGGGIFVARTAEDGISRSLSDSIAMMLETGAVTLEELLDARLMLEVPLAGRAAQRADAELRRAAARGRAGRSGGRPRRRRARWRRPTASPRAIAEAAGNRMAEALIGWVSRCSSPRSWPSSTARSSSRPSSSSTRRCWRAMEKATRPGPSGR